MSILIHIMNPMAALCCDPAHPAVRPLIDMVRTGELALTPRDCFMLVVLHLSTVLEARYLQRRHQLDAEAIRTCHMEAIVLVSEADEGLARGAWPADMPKAPGETLEQAARQEMVRWHTEFDEMPRRLCSQGTEKMSQRECLLALHGIALLSGRLAPGHDLLAALGAATRAAARRSGDTIDRDECSDPALAGNFRIALDKAKSIYKFSYTDHEGRFRLGVRDVRDALAQPKAPRIRSLDAPLGDAGERTLGYLVSHLEGASGIEQYVDNDHLAALKAGVDAHAERRKLASIPGTAVAVVLENLWPLTIGELTVEALAARSGRKRKTLEGALTKERKHMRLDPVLRCLLKFS
jgi:hypothetical protein